MTDNIPYEQVVMGQIAYYEARAPEYDDWWERRGRYDAGSEFNTAWRSDAEQLHRWLWSLGNLGDVLEIAAGTGNWTRHIAQQARSVHAVDASPRSLDLCRAKTGACKTTTEVANIFEWQPHESYDCVFSAFWLSHVPPELWAEHWTLVQSCLRPGGRVIIIESADPRYAAANGPSTWSVGAGFATAEEAAAGTRRRRAVDGVEHLVERHYWTADQLVADLSVLGWSVDSGNTRFAFLYAAAVPVPSA